MDTFNKIEQIVEKIKFGIAVFAGVFQILVYDVLASALFAWAFCDISGVDNIITVFFVSFPIITIILLLIVWYENKRFNKKYGKFISLE